MEQVAHCPRNRSIPLNCKPRGETNSKPNGEYAFLYAAPKAQSRKHGLKNHSKPDELWWRMEHLLMDEDWSPGQIAGVLSKEGVHICKQTIYNHIHADKSGKLAEHTPHKLKYKRRQSRMIVTKATNKRNRTSIHERSAEADGKRFGDWEMDTIVDSYGHAILTLTERSTNHILMEKLKHGRKAEPLATAVARLLFPYRKQVRTITTDNGCEFATHEKISRRLTPKGADRIVVYFTDSYSSWQKGAVENANKLIRRYIPKKANFSNLSDAKIKKIQFKINKRPREKLDFSSPLHAFFSHFD